VETANGLDSSRTHLQAGATIALSWFPAAETQPTQRVVMKQTKFPEGWDEERVKRVLEHYEHGSDEEAMAEEDAGFESTTHTAMYVPVELVPAVRELLAKRSSS
jgi:hypothetical protein